MVAETNLRTITPKSSLDDFVVNTPVRIIGITSPSQNETGLVTFSDTYANLVLVSRYDAAANVVETRGYFVTPYGIKAQSTVQKDGPDSKSYQKYKPKLEVAA